MAARIAMRVPLPLSPKTVLNTNPADQVGIQHNCLFPIQTPATGDRLKQTKTTSTPHHTNIQLFPLRFASSLLSFCLTRTLADDCARPNNGRDSATSAPLPPPPSMTVEMSAPSPLPPAFASPYPMSVVSSSSLSSPPPP